LRQALTEIRAHPESQLRPKGVREWCSYFLETLRIEWRFLPIRFSSDFGAVLNFLRLPGFVRPGTYQAGICNASILVRTSRLFTIISVNGLDIYFTRLTGKIDGVGFSPVSGCNVVEVQELAHPAEPPADLPTQPHK